MKDFPFSDIGGVACLYSLGYLILPGGFEPNFSCEHDSGQEFCRGITAFHTK
jgi:hypothetical protein